MGVLPLLFPRNPLLLIVTCLMMPSPTQGQATQFNACLEDLSARAIDEQVASEVVREVFPRLTYQARVIELDRAQPEFTRSFADYLARRVGEERVARGALQWQQYGLRLEKLTRRYGIPGQYLVAFWGLETNYGRYLGSMSTLDSLATLACDERRPDFFTQELMHALHLIAAQGIQPADMRGSWAGAVGQMQFMPSAYRQFAVDGDGNGGIDLWASAEDALASSANFLRHLGWRTGERWGREVLLPAGFDYTLAGLEQFRPLAEWKDLGLRRADGQALPAPPMNAALLIPAGHQGPAFLVYHNFTVIMGWNRSEFYALSVGRLADRITGAGPLKIPPAPDTDPLSREQVVVLQRQLQQLGFDGGGVDGIFGPATRSALARYQHSRGRIADGFPDPGTVAAVAADAR